MRLLRHTWESGSCGTKQSRRQLKATAPFSWLRGGPARAMIHLGVFAVWPLTLYFNEFCHAFLFLVAKVSNVLISSDCSTPYVGAMARYVLCRVASSPSIS